MIQPLRYCVGYMDMIVYSAFVDVSRNVSLVEYTIVCILSLLILSSSPLNNSSSRSSADLMGIDACNILPACLLHLVSTVYVQPFLLIQLQFLEFY